MCLSPEVDVIAALAIGVVAADTLRRNHNPDARAIAAIPAIFAVHSIFSAIVWWNLRGEVPELVGTIGTWLYIFVAFVLWPIYIPWALRKMEMQDVRKRAFLVLLFSGVVIGAINFGYLVSGQYLVSEHNWFISFDSPEAPFHIGLLYGVATCLSMFVSSHRELRLWGVINIVGILAIYSWAQRGLPSLWCFWAAITTVFINWFIRHHSTLRKST